MPKLQQKTKVEIQRDIINAFVARTGAVDVGNSAALAHLISAFATEGSEIYYQFTRLADLFDFRRARGADLDERAKEILGATVQRIGARRAIGALEFQRAVATGSPVTIPVGTTAKNADGVTVETIEVGTIPAGATSTAASGGNVEARAVDPGLDGNIAATSATTPLAFGSKPAGVQTVFNPANFVGGQDEESDEDLLNRIENVIKSLPRTTVDALAFVVLGLLDPDGSGKVIQYSHVVENLAVPGTAIIYVDDGNNTVVDSATVPILSQQAPATVSLSAVGAGDAQTLTDTATTFPATLVGLTIHIANAGTAANNGTFVITAASGNTVTFTNPTVGAGAEAAATITYFAGENICAGLGGPPPNTAVGGEEYLSLNNKALVDNTLVLYSTTRGAIATPATLGTPLTFGSAPTGQYAQRLSNGVLKFDPALSNGEIIFAGYQHYTGLIREAQKVVDGDTSDRLNYPGWRAAGIDVRVLPPQTITIPVVGVITVREGFDRTTVAAQCETNVVQYINSLGISGDVVKNEIIERIMATPGVYNVALTAPTADITVILDTQLPRTDTTQVQIT